MTTPTADLSAAGVSIWLDDLSRQRITTGNLQELIDTRNVVGVTTNPTIFQGAISAGIGYEEAIDAQRAAGATADEAIFSLTTTDVRDACDIFRPIFDATNGVDGRVSIEVSPDLAHDTDATIAQAKELSAAVDRPNALIKIPATKAGLPAITEVIGSGISVNVTLIFSLERYADVIDAYLAGLEKARAAGIDLASIESVASFFVSRVDGKVDAAIARRLEELPVGAPERAELLEMPGLAAVANARLAYAHFREVFGAPRFAALAARGARVQRPLWASTSTKNPAYPDTLYVDELIGPDTVNTIPPRTLAAYNDHGVLDPRLLRGGAEARALFRRLPELGVPLERLIGELEEEGVAAFVKSFESLLATLEAKRARMAG
jgi:transaldolase